MYGKTSARKVAESQCHPSFAEMEVDGTWEVCYFLQRVGLAVGDIESIQRTASLRALIDQVFLVDTIMKSYPSWILRWIHKSSLEIKPNQNSFLKRVLLAGSDLSAREFMELLLSRKSGSTTPAEEWRQIELARDETQGESIRNLQATVEAQGRLLQAMADRLRILE